MRIYEIEIAYVKFLGGYVIWIDDDPWYEGSDVFPSRASARKEMIRVFANTTEPSRIVWK